MAVADANKQFMIQLTYDWQEIDCDAAQATAAISRALEADVVDAVIGPDCESSCESSAYLTAGRNIAQISYSCSSDVLSNKKKYPTVTTQPAWPARPPSRSLKHLGALALHLRRMARTPLCESSKWISRAVPTHKFRLLEVDARRGRVCEVVQVDATFAPLSPRLDV
jgi:hypothetical protein